MKIYNLFRKTLIISILILLLLSCITPGICRFSQETNYINNPDKHNYNSNKKVMLNCDTYGFSGKSSRQIEILQNDAEILLNKINELAYESSSKEAEKLQQEILEIAQEHNLLPKGTSMKDFKPHFMSSLNTQNPKTGTSYVNGNRGTASICNFATAGTGMQFPIIVLPRLIPILQLPVPRLFLHWNANEGITSCGSLLTGKGFIAEGMQSGTAIGFWGVGFSVFLPPFMGYGFIGYSLFSTCTAENMEPWPPNYAPEIAAIFPQNDATNVLISASELTFSISDENGDEMNYMVTTEPDIGSGSGSGNDGTYSIPISGLEGSEVYTWHVEVSDGQKLTIESYSFSTEEVAPIVSNPNPENCAKLIPIDLSHLSFYLKDPQNDIMEYTVETSPDIGSGSGFGVGEGLYSIEISGLENLSDYNWYVNVTDGENWKHRIFSFQTEPMMIFDPFDEGWQYRKKITINHTKVLGDFANFPLLVSTSDSDLKDNAQNDGDDILFMDNPGIAKRLYHEIERFESASGELIAWVNLTEISSSENTIIYLYYGNSECISQQFPEFVWNSKYNAVYHMNYDNGGLIDSTSNNIDCNTVLGSPEYHNDGKIGYAIDFDRSNNEAFEDGDNFDGLNEMTIEAWINLEKYPESSSSHCMILTHETVWYFGINWESKEVVFDFHGTGIETKDNINCPINDWYYVVGTWSDPEDIVKLFGNGQLKDSSIYSSSMGDEPDHFSVGYKQHHSDFFDGMIDEIRISTIARNEDWIMTTYNNQNTPFNFLSFGDEETGT